MKFNASRFGLALFGLGTLSVLLLILYEPFSETHPISQLVRGQSISACPPRPTRVVPSAEPPQTIPRPTPAPPPTAGPPQPVAAPIYPTLEHPLSSKKQVLRHLLEFDTGFAEWQDPWCVETLRLDPGRIKFKQYPSEQAYTGVKQPPAYRDLGPIWVVTIKGEVDYAMPCVTCTGPTHAFGLTYTISKNTGVVGHIGGLARE